MITLLNHPWTERLGWTLLYFLWQGILVAVLYALARTLAGGRISARARYAIACASLLTMTAAPAVTYWWLGNSGQAARIGDFTALGARQLVPGVVYSPVTDPWQQAMPWIVMVWPSLRMPPVSSGCCWDASPRQRCCVLIMRRYPPNGSKRSPG